jgi:Tfp pilus assembly protein PilW
MTAMNKKPASGAPKPQRKALACAGRAANRSKNDAQEAQKAYVRSLSDGELMRRLGSAADTPMALQKAHGVTQEPDTNEVPNFKKRIIAGAQKATGVSAEDVALGLAIQAAVFPIGENGEGDPERKREQVSVAVETLEEMKPEGALQSMLAVQMIGVHNTAIKFLMWATDKDQTIEGVDAHVLRATRLMRVFNDQLEAFAKLKGKTSEQKVTVEHVHVHEGGQAIVGNVTRNDGAHPGEGEPN